MDAIVVAKTVFIFIVVAAIFTPIMTWVERKQSALMQDRIGANRADILGVTIIGLIHPIADVLKMLTKEDTIPAGAHRFLHFMCPFIAATPAMISFAVIPYGGTYTAWGQEFTLVAADLDYGVLYIFAIASIAAYGTILAGWAGNNNWGILGSLRASAQMISYEVAMGVSVIGIFMIYGSVRSPTSAWGSRRRSGCSASSSTWDGQRAGGSTGSRFRCGGSSSSRSASSSSWRRSWRRTSGRPSTFPRPRAS